MIVKNVLRRVFRGSDLLSKKYNYNRNNCHFEYSLARRFNSSDYIVRSGYPDVDVPEIAVHRYIWKNINKWPNHTAIECGVSGRKFTYNELYLRCRRLGSSLRKLGIKKGDTMAVMIPNTPEFAISYLGSLECGLITCTVNPAYTRDEVSQQLKESKAEWIICHSMNLKTVLEAKKQIEDNLKVICTHNLDGSPPDREEGVILFEELISDFVDLYNFDGEDVRPSDTAIVAFSSGTTGLPKGTCLSHNNIVANLIQTSVEGSTKFIECRGDHQDVIPAVLPLFHMYGNAILLQSLAMGAKTVTLPRFDPKRFLGLLESNRNQLLYIVPPIIFFLGNSNDVSEKHLKGVREMMTAAAPCKAYDIDKVKSKSKTNILFSQGYGLTETSPFLTFYKPEGSADDNYSTAGTLVPNTWAKVLNTNNEALPAGSRGELCFKGPQIMKCYLNNPKATSEMVDSEGWLHSGDVGYYDEDGYFYITDRLKELIKVKGFQVAPAELEVVLRKFPGVLEAGVVGVPSETTGETPVAFVQTEPGAKISEQDIKQFMSTHLSTNKIPTSVRFIPSIPKTASGKILRKDLKKLILNQ